MGRAILEKSHNHPLRPAGRLVIEAVYPI